jgi:NAD(P)H dehydrogenase (quinone)
VTEPPVLPTASYAVTGATGALGRLAVDALLRRGIPERNVFALVRDPSRATELADLGVGVREADYDRPDTLRAALDGIERLLFVSGNEMGRRVDQHTAVISAADAADVGHIVYTSLVHADTSGNPLAPEHAATERALAESGLPHAVARNSFYLEVYTARLGEFVERGEILGAAGEGRVAGATRADFAEAAVSLLSGDIADQVGVHELGGPGFTMAELAEAVTEVTGTTVRYRDLAPDELVAALTGNGAPEATAEFVAALDSSIARGELDTPPDALTRLLGRAPTSLVDAVRAAVI